MDLSSAVLYSGTVFTLTCVVELVSEVDTPVTVLTNWTRNGSHLTNTSRLAVDSVAVQTITSYRYESDVRFNPLSNTQAGGDDGNYTCSARVLSGEYITGSNTSGVQEISVEG